MKAAYELAVRSRAIGAGDSTTTRSGKATLAPPFSVAMPKQWRQQRLKCAGYGVAITSFKPLSRFSVPLTRKSG